MKLKTAIRPNVHEAVMQVEAQEGVAADMVVEEVRRGYLFGAGARGSNGESVEASKVVCLLR